MPIGYPDGNKIVVESSRENYSFETSNSYQKVVGFYRTNLKFNPPIEGGYGTIEWEEYPIRDIGILFECGSVLNDYESELGCIFVHDKDGKVIIDLLWSYNEGPGIPCDTLPDIEPEDYLNVWRDSP